MWSRIILVSVFSYLSLGLDQNALKVGTEYFKYRGVKLVCLLTCKNYADDSSYLQFVKIASNLTIAVSRASLDDTLVDFNQLEKCLQRKLHRVGVLLDGKCEKADDVLNFASKNMWLDSEHKWIIIDSDEANPVLNNNTDIDTIMFDEKHSLSLIEVLRNLNVSVDADIVLATKGISGYNLYDVFNYGRIQGGYLNVNKVASWDVENGFKLLVDLNDYKYYRRWDFQNMSMRMILVVQSSSERFNPDLLTGSALVPGVAIITQISASVLDVIAKLHNFRYVYTTTDKWIGTYERNSTKVVANSLYFREQDISPVIRYWTISDKIDVISTSPTSIETRYYYLIPTEGPGKFENQFLRPLNTTAWWCAVGVLVLCASVLLLSAWLEHRPFPLQYAVFSVVASMCQQFFEDIDDNRAERTSLARKATVLVTGLSSVLIYNYYTSSVVSWLLNGPPPSINTLKELLESPLELIYEDVGYTQSWLQIPTYYFNKRNAWVEDALRQKVFNKKKDAPLLEPLVKGMGMVQKGGYAYHTETNSANALISRTFTPDELCRMGSLLSIEKSLLNPCIQKNSPFKEFFNWSFMRLSEHGIVSSVQIRLSASEVKCEGSSPRALALGGAAPAFILLAGGYLLGTVIMIVERYVYKMQHRDGVINNK